MGKTRKVWEKVCGVRKTAFSFSEEVGSKTYEEKEENWGKNNVENQRKNNILDTAGKNLSVLSTQAKLVNKARNETLNESLVPAVANDSAHLKKDHVSFSPLKRTATKKVINSGNAFSNYVNAELKVDEIFTMDNRKARKKTFCWSC